MILCRDCKHCSVDWLCDAVKVQSPVDGKTEPIRCHDARSNHSQCGPDAKLFEPSTEFESPKEAA